MQERYVTLKWASNETKPFITFMAEMHQAVCEKRSQNLRNFTGLLIFLSEVQNKMHIWMHLEKKVFLRRTNLEPYILNRFWQEKVRANL